MPRPHARRRPVACALAMGAVVLAACTSGGETAEPAATTTTITIEEVPEVMLAGGAYVVPDPIPPGDPGELLAASPIEEPWVPVGARAWRVLYRSTGLDGQPIAVSGLLVAPDGPPPEDGFPVVAWGHGTTGIADVCAPSLSPNPGIPYLESMIDAGWVVAASDYEGLGTPGVHPYLVGLSEGRSVLDAARAARFAAGGEQVVVWGHSQGGHAALWAGQIAPGYSPDLDLRGVVAAAPAAELGALLEHAIGNPLSFGFLAMAGYAYADAYPDIEIDALLTEQARELLPILDQQCIPNLLLPWAAVAGEALVVRPLEIEAIRLRVAENTPGLEPSVPPVLVVQGDADPIVPAPTTEVYVERACSVGTTVRYSRYEGADHGSVLALAREEVLAFITTRFRGQPVMTTCPAA